MSTPRGDASTRSRRNRRLALVVLMLSLAGSTAVVWLSGRINRYFEQAHAVAAIKAIGGTVSPRGPLWLRAMVGERTSFRINLSNTRVSDDDLRHLGAIHNLTALHLRGSGVTDEALTHLQDLTDLRVLDLSATEISDAGLAHLAGLTDLEELYLQQTGVTNAGIVHLGNMANLRTLQVAHTSVTAEGLEPIRRLPRVVQVTLGGPRKR